MRFFLDNCLAIRHARALHEMVKPEHSFTHLQDKFLPATKDVDWIGALGREGDWSSLATTGSERARTSAGPGMRVALPPFS